MAVENLHKKFGDDLSKIVDFFLLSNFWWSFLCFLKNQKKEKNDHQKLDIKKKSTIFEISTPNFLCKFSIPKNPSIPILEQKSSHLLKKFSFLVTYLSPVANLMEHPLILIILELKQKIRQQCSDMFVKRTKKTTS